MVYAVVLLKLVLEVHLRENDTGRHAHGPEVEWEHLHIKLKAGQKFRLQTN